MRDKLSPVVLALLVLASGAAVAGCEDEPKKQPEVVVEPQPTKEVAPSGPLDQLAAPDAVLIYGGIDKPNDLASHLSELVLGSAAPGAEQLTSGVSTLALRFGLKDGSGLDATKPIRFAIIDPKANEQPFAVAIGVKSRDAFVKSLPEKHKKDDAGNGFSFVTAGMNAVFVNIVDDWAVFTGQKEVFGANKAFLVKLIGATVKGDGGAVVDIAHASKLYATELEKGIADAKANITKAASTLPMGGGFDKIVDWMGSVSKELDKVVLTSNASKDAGRLQIDLVAKANSDLDKTFKSLGARKLEPMLGRLPADAPAALVASFDPDAATDFIRSLASWSLQLSLGQGASQADYSEAMNAYWKASNGDMAIVAHAFAEKLRLSMLMGVRDAKVVGESMEKLRGIYKEESVKQIYDKMGIEFAFKKDAYKVGSIGVDTVTAKLGEPKSKEAGQLNLKQAMGPAGGIFAEMMNHHFAVAEDRVVSVYGAESKDLMTAWLEGKVTGGLDKTPGVVRALKEGAPGMFFVLYGSPLAVAQALQEGAGAPSMAAASGIAVTAGSTGGTVHIVLDVPGDQAQAIARLAGSLGPM